MASFQQSTNIPQSGEYLKVRGAAREMENSATGILTVLTLERSAQLPLPSIEYVCARGVVVKVNTLQRMYELISSFATQKFFPLLTGHFYLNIAPRELNISP